MSRFVALVSSVIVARLLGQEAFGKLGVVQNTIAMFGVLAGFGLGVTATKHVAELRDQDPARAGGIIALSEVVSLATGIAMAIALYLGAPWLATQQLSEPSLSGPLRIGSLLLLFNAISGAKAGALAGFEAFRAIAVRNILSGMLSVPFMIAGAHWFGLEGTVWGLAASTAANCVLNDVALRAEGSRRGIVYSLRNAPSETHLLWCFSLPAVLAGLLVGPVNWICTAMLARQPNGFFELGAFSAANHYRNALLYLPGLLGQVLLPLLSERNASHGSAAVTSTLRSVVRLNALVSGLAVAVVAALSPGLMALYGSGFRASWPVLVVLLGATYLQIVQAPLIKYIEATGRMWANLAMNAVWGTMVILSTSLLISRGALGLSLAQFAAFFVFTILLFAYHSLSQE